MNIEENYNAEEDTAELARIGKLPKPLRLAAIFQGGKRIKEDGG